MTQSEAIIENIKTNELKRSRRLNRYFVIITLLLLGFLIWLKIDSTKSIGKLNNLVIGQSTTLTAIESATKANKTNSDKNGQTIICMLQVPVEQRTTDTEAKCRKQAEAQTIPAPANNAPQIKGAQQNNTSQGQTEKPSTPNQNSNLGQGDNKPPDNSGIITPSVPIPFTDIHVPQIHIGSPF